MRLTGKQRTGTRRRVGLTVAAGSGALALGLMGAGQASAATSFFHGHDAHRHEAKYTALGDSYASSPGVPDQVDATCLRSDNNYPSLIARHQHWKLTDVSCTGATTFNVLNAEDSEPPQLKAVKRDTGVVSLSFGGNDINFTDDITACVGLTTSDPTGAPCRQHFTAGGTDELASLIQQTGPKVRKVLKAVHKRAPHARVLVVGYPDLFPDRGPGCTSSTNPLAMGDFTYLRNTEKKLNAMLAHEARAGGAQYVDTYTRTIGHDICTPEGQRFVEPLVTTPPVAPLHPNAQGDKVMAATVERALHRAPHHHW